MNSLVAAIRAGGSWDRLRPALLLVVLMAAIQLALQILRSATVYVRTAQSELVQDHISSLIHQKSAAADLGFYDSAEFYDHLYRARSEAAYRPVALVESLGSLVQNAITLAAMGAVLVPFGAWLPGALLIGTGPALYAAVRNALLENRWRHRVTPAERRAWYYDWLLTTGETALEVRLFGLGGPFSVRVSNLAPTPAGGTLESGPAAGAGGVRHGQPGTRGHGERPGLDGLEGGAWPRHPGRLGDVLPSLPAGPGTDARSAGKPWPALWQPAFPWESVRVSGTGTARGESAPALACSAGGRERYTPRGCAIPISSKRVAGAGGL